MKFLFRLLTLRFLEDPKSIKNKENISKKRTKMIFTILFVFFFVWILIFNIGQMTILGTIRGQDLSKIAEEKYTVDSVIEARRGKIYDRNGAVLADNIESYKLIAVVSEKASENIKDGEEMKHVVDKSKTAEELSKYIPLSKEEIEKILNNERAYQVEFASAGKNIDVETKRKIEELKLPGIGFQSTSKRYYPNASILGNFLGFAQASEESNQQIQGRLGIEKVFDHYLSGKNGRIIYGRDAWGKVVSNIPVHEEKAVEGADLHLTIDKNIQTFVDNTLGDIQEKYNPESAFAFVVSAKTGEILAAGQTPAFNPNTMENLDSAWTNILYNSSFEPGSTMKTFTLALMIENGIFAPDKYYKSGSYRVGDTTIFDHNRTGWGRINYRHGFQESSNTLMLTMLAELGEEKLKNGLERFGFGKITDSLYENESRGKLSFDNKVSAASAVFGQGSAVTPIQMLQAETAILNEGNMLKPYFLKKIYDKTQNKDINVGDKQIVGTPISKETAEKVKVELEGVVNGQWANSGSNYKLEGYNVAGKTGTAEIANPDTGKYYESKYQVLHSFLGYAPSENPEVIVYAGMKMPRKNLQESYRNSVKEIFNPIMTTTLEYLNIKKISGKSSNETFILDEYSGKELKSSINELSKNNISVVQIGSGKNIIAQFPQAKTEVSAKDKIFLVTENSATVLPNLKNWSKSDILKYSELSGVKFNINGSGYVTSQNVSPGQSVKSGDEITVNLT